MKTYSQYQAFKPAGVAGASNLREPTPADIEGPFYKVNAPFRHALCSPEEEGEHMTLAGQVVNVNGVPIAYAILDFWQADAKGAYDLDGFKFRGKITTDGEGRYLIKTVVPGDYQIADSPPDFRCAHIHVKVTATGHKPLTTQLYFKDDRPNGTFDFVLEKS